VIDRSESAYNKRNFDVYPSY